MDIGIRNHDNTVHYRPNSNGECLGMVIRTPEERGIQAV